MRICIDSNIFVLALEQRDADAEALLQHLPLLDVAIPRLVMREVLRNLTTPSLDKQFFQLVQVSPQFAIVEDLVPPEVVAKYARHGLPAKADALIGAFAEWQGVRYLVSDNRHFLNLSTDAFTVMRPGEFLSRFKAGTL